VSVINNLSEKQNELDFLQIQFCARHLYNVATILNYIAWLCCILTTIVLPLLSDLLGSLNYVIAVVVNILVIVIGVLSSRFVKLGAAYKMRFDYKLYQFQDCEIYQGYTTDRLREIAAKIINRYKKSYIKAISHNGTDKPNGVKDWYVEISKDMSRAEAIKNCQKQNGFFDKEIMKIAWWVFVGLVSALIIVFVILNLTNTVAEAVIYVLSGFALIKMIVTEIYYYVMVYAMYYFEDKVKDEPEVSPLTRQKIIDERRKLNLITPNIIYKIKSFKLHSLVKAEEHIQI